MQPSAGKATVSVFWDTEGISLVQFLKTGATIKSELYEQTLKKLQQRIGRVRPKQTSDLHVFGPLNDAL